MNLLPYAIYLSFAGALLALLAGSRAANTVRWIALTTAVSSWILVLAAAVDFTPAAGLQTIVNLTWIPEMSVR